MALDIIPSYLLAPIFPQSEQSHNDHINQSAAPPSPSELPSEDTVHVQPLPPVYDNSVNDSLVVVPSRTLQSMRGCFAPPSVYIGPSLRPSLHPYYSSSDSFDCPPPGSVSFTVPSKHSRQFLPRIGRKVSSSSQAESLSTPLPPCFSRPSPPNLSYSTFTPIYLIANGTHLCTGFPILPPLSSMQPHPFVTHDVSEADWTR